MLDPKGSRGHEGPTSGMVHGRDLQPLSGKWCRAEKGGQRHGLSSLFPSLADASSWPSSAGSYLALVMQSMVNDREQVRQQGLAQSLVPHAITIEKILKTTPSQIFIPNASI